MTAQSLISLLSKLPPTADVLLENGADFIAIETAIHVGKVLPVYPGSRAHVEADPGEGGNSAYVLK